MNGVGSGTDLLAWRENCKTAAARRSDADLQKTVRAGKGIDAELQLDVEDAARHSDGREALRRADLISADEAIEERKLKIVGVIGRRAALGQATLISKRRGLGENSGGSNQRQ